MIRDRLLRNLENITNIPNALNSEFKALTRKDKIVMSLIAGGVMIVGGILPAVGIANASINPVIKSEPHFFTASASQTDIDILEMRSRVPKVSIIEMVAELHLPMRVYLTSPMYSGQFSKEIDTVRKLYPGANIVEDYSLVNKGRSGGLSEGSFQYDELGVNRAVLYYP